MTRLRRGQSSSHNQPPRCSRRFVCSVCFNTWSMDRQRAEQLHALLSDIEPELAEPALQPLERLARTRSVGDALIVAIVGPSGVGKSELINLLASSRVVTAGPLRPTTTEIAVWGDIADTYLPGRRVPGPNRPDRVVLIDTPPAEHYPDTIAGLLHLVDASLGRDFAGSICRRHHGHVARNRS